MDGEFTTEEMILLIRNPDLNKMVKDAELKKRHKINKEQEELREKLWIEENEQTKAKTS